MPYEQSLDIERRLEAVLRMISTGRYSTPQIAEKLKVSIPTISRCVTALRDRGHGIRAEKHSAGWRYVLADAPSSRSMQLRNGKMSTISAKHPR